jgi:COMPASS component SWD3
MPPTLPHPTPAGKYLLSTALDSKLRLWNYEKVAIAKSYEGHRHEAYCSAPAFCSAGARGTGQQPWLVAGSEDGSILVWGLNSKKVGGSRAGGAAGLVCSTAHLA